MIKLEITGQMRTFDVTDDVPLLWALHDVAPMTGTKFGCGMALCSACTVHVDGVATRSCVLGKRITTVEGVSATRVGRATQVASKEHEHGYPSFYFARSAGDPGIEFTPPLPEGIWPRRGLAHGWLRIGRIRLRRK
jgi:hypothetical protein